MRCPSLQCYILIPCEYKTPHLGPAAIICLSCFCPVWSHPKPWPCSEYLLTASCSTMITGVDMEGWEHSVQGSTRPPSGQCGSLGWRVASDSGLHLPVLRGAQVFHFKYVDGFWWPSLWIGAVILFMFPEWGWEMCWWKKLHCGLPCRFIITGRAKMNRSVLRMIRD